MTATIALKKVIEDLAANPLDSFDRLYASKSSGRLWNLLFPTSPPFEAQEQRIESILPKMHATIWKLKEKIDQDKEAIFSDRVTVGKLLEFSEKLKCVVIRSQEKSDQLSDESQSLYRIALHFENYLYMNISTRHENHDLIQLNALNYIYYFVQGVKYQNKNFCKAFFEFVYKENLMEIFLNAIHFDDRLSFTMLLKASYSVSDETMILFSLEQLTKEDFKQLLIFEKFSLQDLFNRSKFSDFTLKVTDDDGKQQHYFLNRNILMSHSEYFAGLFQQGFQWKESEILEFQVTTQEIFEQILYFIYSGEITVTVENCAEIYKYSQYLMIEELCKICREQFQIIEYDPPEPKEFNVELKEFYAELKEFEIV